MVEWDHQYLPYTRVWLDLLSYSQFLSDQGTSIYLANENAYLMPYLKDSLKNYDDIEFG